MHVHWHEGLFLQPHHLQLMQRELQTDVRAARSLLTPYCYGVVESKLSYDDLADGRIRFEHLRAIMPSGQEVFFPENANLPALDIKAELARGGTGMEILLVVPLYTRGRANSFRQGDQADPRIKLLYIPEDVREIADENTGENRQSVHLRKINARVALKKDDLSDTESLPILRVIRSVGEDSGKPRPDPEFVPPSLLLKSSPTLHDMMRELSAQLNASRSDLRVKAATGGMGLEVKWELTMRLTVLNRFCGSLPSIVEEGIISPFAIYLQLRELLGELLALYPEKTTFDCEAYNHLDPLRSFKELDLKIRDLIRVTKGIEPLRVPFAGNPGLLRATLEPQHFEKPTGYYLGVATRADRTKLALYLSDANKFKLMPRSMEQVAIFGVELKEENHPPLDLPGQSNLYYFRVVPTSNQRRWDTIKQDKAISLVWNNSEMDLSDAKFTLFMTLPSA
ncbi:MAG TPA: type VI secretion system baseplate subunit TssK [Verrucomicrobiae bacterium]|jgi:type VI secretion system ImpJ/VasE family protein|nr:type VI secretion system baseplate subunit TssK [Verrucomicrobiae bacterium]